VREFLSINIVCLLFLNSSVWCVYSLLSSLIIILSFSLSFFFSRNFLHVYIYVLCPIIGEDFWHSLSLFLLFVIVSNFVVLVFFVILIKTEYFYQLKMSYEKKTIFSWLFLGKKNNKITLMFDISIGEMMNYYNDLFIA